jgi:hypothetical protein
MQRGTVLHFLCKQSSTPHHRPPSVARCRLSSHAAACQTRGLFFPMQVTLVVYLPLQKLATAATKPANFYATHSLSFFSGDACSF